MQNMKESESRDCPAGVRHRLELGASSPSLKRTSAVCCSKTDSEHLCSSDEEEAQRCSTSGWAQPGDHTSSAVATSLLPS